MPAYHLIIVLIMDILIAFRMNDALTVGKYITKSTISGIHAWIDSASGGVRIAVQIIVKELYPASQKLYPPSPTMARVTSSASVEEVVISWTRGANRTVGRTQAPESSDGCSTTAMTNLATADRATEGRRHNPGTRNYGQINLVPDGMPTRGYRRGMFGEPLIDGKVYRKGRRKATSWAPNAR